MCRLLCERGGSPLLGRQWTHQLAHAVERPLQIHRCGAGAQKLGMGRLQCPIPRVLLQSQHEAIGPGDTNQWGPAHHHGADGISRLLATAQGAGLQAMGQLGLINHPHRATIGGQADGAPGLSINPHRAAASRVPSSLARPPGR